VILVVVKQAVRAKYADEFPALIAEYTEATRAEPGNISFDWYRSVDDPTLYVLIEAFEDRAAGDAHVASVAFAKVSEQLPRYLAAAPEIVNVDVPGWSH
jgi:quinol monooxygenase YgiN